MKQQQTHPDVYQLRIVLRGISPLIWRRLLVRGDTTLAQLHLILQLSFEWSNKLLHHFHIFGKDYGSDGADTRHITLDAFGFQKGERFRYIYNYYAHWQCDIRLESTLPLDPRRFYPVCTGGQRPICARIPWVPLDNIPLGCNGVVYLQPADKYRRLTHHPF